MTWGAFGERFLGVGADVLASAEYGTGVNRE
jgi:hypothetical protein